MTDIETKADLWGYAKRFLFVLNSIRIVFSDRIGDQLRILDVGCGNGSQLGLPLARHGFQVTGIDMHGPSIDAARREADGFANVRFVCGSVVDLDAEPFDVIILSEVLEHVREPETLLRDSLRQLKEDGLVIVTVPNGYGEFEWDSWVFRSLGFEYLIDQYEKKRAGNNNARQVASSTENMENRHIQFFTLRRIRKLFGDCSLTIVDEAAASLMSGPFVGHMLARSAGFLNWNSRITDSLPLFLASGWYFALRPQNEGKE